MADTARPPSIARAAPETPCAHCGLPVGPAPVLQNTGAFCCTGCAVVHEALGSAGFGETFYRLRAVGRERPAARPAAPDALQLAELDTARFLEEETRPADGGLRACELFVDGVHCAACVWLVERLPFEMEGVAGARLDLPRARLALTFDPARVRLSAVAAWLARFGYAARPARSEALGRRTEAERRLLVRLGVAWALAGNVMLVAFALYSGLDVAGGPMATAARWASLALTVPAVGYGAAPFFRRAWASVRAAVRARDGRRLHMDTPIALGVAVGFGHSAWATVTGRGEVWFDSVAVLVAALLTARYLQLRSRRLAGEAAERLLTLVPTMARRVGEGGTVEVIRQDELQPGDVVEVPAGEVVPVDGVVVRGESRLDNAVLTGEARPVPAAEGARVAAGATNLQAPLRVRTDAVGEATRVGRLLAWVREADRRAPVVLLADRLGGVFVLGVLVLAAVTAALWLWLDPSRAAFHVAALLVITCPCALGMATPLAMAVAAGRAARAGLFVKTDEATQRLTDVDAVVLDKTGTLTEGQMALVEWAGDAEALRLAAALEAHSNHPVAAALVRAQVADPSVLPVERFEAVAGSGVRGEVAGRTVVVGRLAWCAEQAEGEPPPELRSAFCRFAGEGHTPVAVLVGKTWAGVAALGDRIRDDAAPLIRTLEGEGKAVYLLSGDHPAAVAAVAHRLGLPPERARGGVSPEGKRAAVERLQAGGRVVLMVGDGVNDAAALRAADVGVAVGGGATASLVAADVFLTRPGVAAVAELLGGARAVMRTVRRLLAVSLAYNAAGAAAAVAGLVTPLVAAVAMPLSSLAVVGLAILQPSFRRPHAGSG